MHFRRGALAAQINVGETRITVTGAVDAQRAADLVGKVVDDRNDGLVRNMQGAVR